jgi:hypothetical protein
MTAFIQPITTQSVQNSRFRMQQLATALCRTKLVIGVGRIKWPNARGAFYCRAGLASIKDHLLWLM